MLTELNVTPGDDLGEGPAVRGHPHQQPVCLGVFVTGVSLTLLAPFYPSEALKKVDS